MTITAKRYFQLSLIAPIVIPFLFLPFYETAIAGLLVASLIFGGIPYVLFALAVFVWSQGMTSRQLERFSYLAPLAFGLFLAFCYLVYFLAFGQEDPDIAHWASILGLFSLYGVGVGYAYVLIVNLGHYILYERKVEP